MSTEPRYPYDPARTMARAYRTGLTGLRDLLRERVINNLQDVFDSTQEMWTEAQKKWEESKQQGNKDFSHITRVERHLRANFLKMIWETTARYGNTEYKRIQNERKGKIGPMNRLLNMAGAQMRNFAVTRFPFPMPDVMEREGKQRIYGYTGGETFPRVHVTHATLPEMDFVDMIRSHVFELCRKCFIYNVPMRDARQYVNLLIYRLSPFLEYLYTSGESGRWGFKRKRKTRSGKEVPDADRILHRIVREIRGLYATGYGRPRTVTDRLGEEYEPQGVSLFLDESIRLRESEDEESEEEWGYYLRDLCDREILQDRDAHWLQAEAKNRARWYGIRLHRILTMGLPQPYKARSVILEGDKFAEIGKDILIVAELPLKTNLGEGRADIVIFRRYIRERSGDRSEIVVWRPIAVFDIKSKTAFDWWIEGERRNSKRHGDVTIPTIRLKRRKLTEDEWSNVLARTPSRYEQRQSEVYAGALLSEYADLTKDTTGPLPITGTIVVDVAQDNAVLQKNLLRLLKSLFEDYSGDLTSEKMDVRLDDYHTQHLHLSLVINKPAYEQRKMVQEQGDSVEEMEIESGLNSDSSLMLYCSVPSGSRSGPTADWISKYWHGLEYLYSMCENSGIQRVIWIDVSGDLRTKRLARTRLRVNEHRSQIKRFFRDIEIVNASEQMQSFFFRGRKMPTLQSILPDSSIMGDNPMIVVSGWEELEQMVPEKGQPALREFKRVLVDDLRESGKVTLWFEKFRRGEETSSIYQRSKSLPFSKYSPFYGNVKKVIWNLPTQPYATGQTTPMWDDLRIIAEQGDEGIRTCTAEIPILRNWSSKFWNKRGFEQYRDSVKKHRGRQVLEKEHVLSSAILEQDLRTTALDLLEGVPGIDSDQGIPDDVPILSIESVSVADRNLKILRTPILTFCPKITRASSGLGYLASSTTIPPVTQPRRYRALSRRNSAISRTYRPPDESGLVFNDFDIKQVYKIEIDRIKKVLKLGNSLELLSTWSSFHKGLVNVLERCEEKETGRLFSDFLKSHPISAELWENMSWLRNKVMHSNLSNESKLQLDGLLTDVPNLVLDTGNYLFLMLLMVKYTQPDISDDELTKLWSSLKPWQLLQLGFVRGHYASGRPSFDVEVIWTDILLRVSCIRESPLPSTPTIRYGRILVVEGPEEGYDYWFLLQKEPRSTDMISGMWHNTNPIEPSDRFHWSVIRSDILASSAQQVKSPLEYEDIAICDSAGKSVLWIRSGDIWNPVGSIELIRKRNDELNCIRGVRVERALVDSDSTQIAPERDLSEYVTSHLEQIQKQSGSCIAVECFIELDSESYILGLHSSETGKKNIHELLVFESTQELVDFLRMPLTIGSPIENQVDSKRYTWNPYTDVHYDDLDFLKLFVERKKPFVRSRISLPPTAKDVVANDIVPVNLMIKHDTNQCPICQGINDDHAACWILEVVDDVPEAIVSMLSVGFTDIEIGEILNTQDIHVQGSRYKVYIEFPPEGDNDRIVFRESRIFAQHLHEKRVPRVSFLRLNEETLLWKLFNDSESISISIQSNITGDMIYSGPLVNLFKGMDIELAMEHVETTIENILENKCSGNACERIQSYDELLEKVNEIIIGNV